MYNLEISWWFMLLVNSTALLGAAWLLCAIPAAFYNANFDDDDCFDTSSAELLGRLFLIFLGVITMLGCVVGFCCYGAITNNWIPIVCWSIYYLFDQNDFYQGPMATAGY